LSRGASAAVISALLVACLAGGALSESEGKLPGSVKVSTLLPSLSGSVVDQSGPVAWAIVGIKAGTSPGAMSNATKYVVCDKSGRFGPVSLSAGTYKVAAWVDGLKPSEDQTINLQTNTTVTISLDPMGRVVSQGKQGTSNWTVGRRNNWGTYIENTPNYAFDGWPLTWPNVWYTAVKQINDAYWWDHPWDAWWLPFADSGLVTSVTSTTLTDTSKSWTTDQWKDHYLTITDASDQISTWRTYWITGNTANTLTIDGAHGDLVAAGIGSGWKSYIRKRGQEYPGYVTLVVDLGADTAIDSALLWTWGAGVLDNKVQYCLNADDPTVESNWHDVYSSGTTTVAGYMFPSELYINPYRFPAASGRYWRLRIGNTVGNNVCILEWQLCSATQTITVTHGNKIGSVRRQPDGTQVGLAAKIVTEWSYQEGVALPSWRIYVEDAGRSSGVLVFTDSDTWGQRVGNAVNVVGVMTTTPDGERAINAKSTASGSVTWLQYRGLIEPMGMTAKTAQGAMAEGMLVRVFGSLKSIDPPSGSFWLDDGSDPDGPGLRLVTGNVFPGAGSLMAFDGVAAKVGGERAIYVSTRRARVQFVCGDALAADGWIRSWLMNGYWNVANPGGDEYYWQKANIDHNFIGEGTIQPYPGLVTGGKPWFVWTNVGWDQAIGLGEQPFAAPPFPDGICCMYAQVYLYSPLDYSDESGPNGIAEIRIGSDDGVKAVLNSNTSVLADYWIGAPGAARRGTALDQDKVAVPLCAGWNSLLLKVNNCGGGYGFVVRFMCDDPVTPGRKIPIPGLRYSLYPM